MRELLGPLVDGWSASVHVVDPQGGLGLYVPPLIDRVIARWDLLLAAHRRRTLFAVAASALTAIGEDGRPHARLAAGEPVNEAEWFGMERWAQLLARLLPIARELNPGDWAGLAGPLHRGPPHR